jgi:hypothetical protein
MRYAEGPTAEATVHVSAPPEVLWALVSDIHLVASLSREVQEVAWLDDVREPAVGAAFKGRSRHPQVGEWTTTSRVVACDPPRVFELTPHEGGTELRQWARMGPGFSLLCEAIATMPDKEERIVAGRLREWQAAIEANLAALKELAELRARA